MATGDGFDRETKIVIARQGVEKGRPAAEVSEEFSLSDKIDADLAVAALKDAIRVRKPAAGLTAHSDHTRVS